MKILVLNAGSSSQKSCLYEIEGDGFPQNPVETKWKADIDWNVNREYGVLEVKANNTKIEKNLELKDKKQGIASMLNTLVEGETKVVDDLSSIDIVGHRVVHGGSKYSQATLIDSEVKETIEELIPLAPNHNPAHLEGIQAIAEILPEIPQVAVFDTAFHAQMPKSAAVYPIPYEWYEKGIRRYGFHGISHKYCSHRAADILNRSLSELKIITCHLGNGCSLAAVDGGKSIDTTMGFTPLEGLMMGSRSGSIDPAILIYLLQEYELKPNRLYEILNKESGLKGVSGESSDMRVIQKAIEKGNERAQLAFDIYIHRLKAGIASMLASLGGLDVMVFSAGIGENTPAVREKICQAFNFLGLKIDSKKNSSSPMNEDIATPDSQVRVLVLHTEEDWAIAQECWYIKQSL